MIDCIALAKILELQNQTLHDQWRRNEDLFYQAYSHEHWALVSRLGEILDRAYAWLKTKKADRPDIGRSACDSGACCGQAASAR
ncbi:hypothetical protein [Rhizobium sp. ICMP 5592]|uniref:hypothetical protein n=1 Tax=Rhizobium sp. ICMP 5592 TaxID=2292445 RepID=UPI0012959D94|nr:hypothetical protein [Rhizobium sp. ICMP 5592]MQB44120.1 hypothetical protein [Rhizobium sp. ICMP 5592]